MRMPGGAGGRGTDGAPTEPRGAVRALVLETRRRRRPSDVPWTPMAKGLAAGALAAPLVMGVGTFFSMIKGFDRAMALSAMSPVSRTDALNGRSPFGKRRCCGRLTEAATGTGGFIRGFSGGFSGSFLDGSSGGFSGSFRAGCSSLNLP